MRSSPAIPIGRASALACLLLVGASGASAQSPISLSPDVTIPLYAPDLVTRDDSVVVAAGIVGFQWLGTIPESADVIGYADGGGIRLITFDTTVSLAGGVVARPGDVVSWNGVVYALAFDATLAGLPDGVRTDAVAIAAAGGLVLSFDSSVSLPGGLHVADEDLVRWNGSAFSLALDGSAAGIDRALDIDAVDDLGGSSFLVSFDSGGSVGGVSFADEDILRRAGGVWSLERDLSASDADWEGADLDAMQVPEPGHGAMLAAAALLLARLARAGGRMPPGSK